jgi:hypothetical protein
MSLAPLADHRVLLGRPGVTDEARAAQAVEAASSAFRAAVRHPVTLVDDDVVTVYGRGTRDLVMPAAPIVDVTLIVAKLSTGDEPVDMTSGYVQIRKRDGILRRWVGWADDCEFEVTYSHGYAVVPEEIANAVLNAARVGYDARPGNVTSATLGPQSLSFGSQVTGGGGGTEWDRVVATYLLNAGERV